MSAPIEPKAVVFEIRGFVDDTGLQDSIHKSLLRIRAEAAAEAIAEVKAALLARIDAGVETFEIGCGGDDHAMQAIDTIKGWIELL